MVALSSAMFLKAKKSYLLQWLQSCFYQHQVPSHLPLLGLRLPLLQRREPARGDVCRAGGLLHGGGPAEADLLQDRQPQDGGAHRRRRQ